MSFGTFFFEPGLTFTTFTADEFLVPQYALVLTPTVYTYSDSSFSL